MLRCYKLTFVYNNGASRNFLCNIFHQLNWIFFGAEIKQKAFLLSDSTHCHHHHLHRHHARGVKDEETRRQGGPAGRHERGEDIAAPQVHGEEIQGNRQHRWRGLLHEAVGPLQHLHMGHSR